MKRACAPPTPAQSAPTTESLDGIRQLEIAAVQAEMEEAIAARERANARITFEQHINIAYLDARVGAEQVVDAADTACTRMRTALPSICAELESAITECSDEKMQARLLGLKYVLEEQLCDIDEEMDTGPIRELVNADWTPTVRSVPLSELA